MRQLKSLLWVAPASYSRVATEGRCSRMFDIWLWLQIFVPKTCKRCTMEKREPADTKHFPQPPHFFCENLLFISHEDKSVCTRSWDARGSGIVGLDLDNGRHSPPWTSGLTEAQPTRPSSRMCGETECPHKKSVCACACACVAEGSGIRRARGGDGEGRARPAGGVWGGRRG